MGRMVTLMEKSMKHGIDTLSVLLNTRNRYINILETALTGSLFRDTPQSPWSEQKYDPVVRMVGRDWPSLALSMIGTIRMRHLRHLCETVIQENIPGDFIETGVWRGGACIFMKGILEAYGDRERRIFLADSFAGLPVPNPDRYPADAGDLLHSLKQLAVSRLEVEENFLRYGLLDDRVIFLEGWFKDTLPAAPIDHIAILRLDGDTYESTMQALEALYHKVSPGGFVIIDDFVLPRCAAAVRDYWSKNNINVPIFPIDGTGVWCRVLH